jgi:hypothetical protein
MKIVRTVRQVVEVDDYEPQGMKPQLGIGDYVEVYCGHNEGHHFWIKDIRFNADVPCFEYLYDDRLMGGWHGERCLVLRERAA